MGIVFSGKYEQGYGLVKPDQTLLLELKLDSSVPRFFTGPLKLKCRQQRWLGALFAKEQDAEEVVDISAWDEGEGNVQWEPVCHRLGLRNFGHTRYRYYTDPQFSNIPDRSFSLFSTTYSTLAKLVWLAGLFLYFIAWWVSNAGLNFTVFELGFFSSGLVAGLILPVIGKLTDFVTNRTSSGRSLPFWGVFMSLPRAVASVLLAFVFVFGIFPQFITRVENRTDDTVVFSLAKRGGGTLALTLPPHASELLLGHRNVDAADVQEYSAEEGKGFYTLSMTNRRLNFSYKTASIDCDAKAVRQYNTFFGFDLTGRLGNSTSPDKKSCIVKRDVVLSTGEIAEMVGKKSFVGETKYTSAELYFHAPYEVISADPKILGIEHPLMSDYHLVKLLESSFPRNREDTLFHLETDVLSNREDDWFRRARITSTDGQPIGPVYIPIRKNRPLAIPMITRSELGEANRRKLFCARDDDPKARMASLRYMAIVDGAGRPVKLKSITFKQSTRDTPVRYSVLWRVENEIASRDAFVCVPRSMLVEDDLELIGRVNYRDENSEEYNFSKAIMTQRENRIELRLEDVCFVDAIAAIGHVPTISMACKNPCNAAPDDARLPMVERAADISELECMRYEYCGNCSLVR